MNTKKCFAFIACLSIFLSACEKKEELFLPQDAIAYAGVDADFIPFVQRFVYEGAKRGFTIDFASRAITIQFVNIDQQQSPNVAGMCSHDGGSHHAITIDVTFWKNASELQKEFILFHELGHCYLYRAHRDGAFPNGLCLSIMRGAAPGCRDAYTLANRDYYIDELFSIANDISS